MSNSALLTPRLERKLDGLKARARQNILSGQYGQASLCLAEGAKALLEIDYNRALIYARGQQAYAKAHAIQQGWDSSRFDNI